MGLPDRWTRVLWLAEGLGPGGMEHLLMHNARLGDRDLFDYRPAYLVERSNSIVPELKHFEVLIHGIGLESVRSALRRQGALYSELVG